MPFDLDHDELVSLVITLTSTGVIAVALPFAYQSNVPIAIAMLAGALGGLAHEFAQSSGVIAFIKKKEDGVYLGSTTGLVLGLVAGFLIFQNFSTGSDNQILLGEAVVAGLGLKGVAEAVGGQATFGNKQNWFIENIDDHKLPHLIITVRNKGIDNVHIDVVYINHRLVTLPNTSISPGTSSPIDVDISILDFRQNETHPSSYKIQMVSATGISRTAGFNW